MAIEGGPEGRLEGGVERGPEFGGGRRDASSELLGGVRRLADSSRAITGLTDDPLSTLRRLRGHGALPQSLRGVFLMGSQYTARAARNALLSMEDEYVRMTMSIEETPLAVIIPSLTPDESGSTQLGVLAAIIGAEVTDEGTRFKGIVAMGERGRDGLLAVRITPDGDVTLHPDYGGELPQTSQERRQKILAIFPPPEDHV